MTAKISNSGKFDFINPTGQTVLLILKKNYQKIVDKVKNFENILFFNTLYISNIKIILKIIQK